MLEKVPAILQKVSLINLLLALFAVVHKLLDDGVMMFGQHMGNLLCLRLQEFCCLLEHNALHVFELLVELGLILRHFFGQNLVHLLIADLTEVQRRRATCRARAAKCSKTSKRRHAAYAKTRWRLLLQTLWLHPQTRIGSLFSSRSRERGILQTHIRARWHWQVCDALGLFTTVV